MSKASSTLSVLQIAIEEQQVVALTYLAADKSYSEREVESLALYHTSNTGWRLVA